MSMNAGYAKTYHESPEEELICILKFASFQKIKAFISKNSEMDLHYPTWNLQTPLTSCIDRQDPEILSFLLEKISTSLDETLTQPCGTTALMYASFNTTNTEILRVLLKYKADLNKRDMKGWTCLQYAVIGERLNNIIFLLEEGLSIDTRDFQNQTSLMISVHLSNLKVLELLLHYGANVAAYDEIGYTALHLAIMHRKRDAAILLMQNGSDTRNALPVTKDSLVKLSEITMPNLLPVLQMAPFNH